MAEGSVLGAALTAGWLGGTSGALAMVLQVLALLWLRTVMNYQYRHGTSTTAALARLWAEGGVARLYRGLAPALVQGPLARFGDTAANVAVLAFLESTELPLAFKTGLASLTSASWRLVIMPVDTVKTTLQTEGAKGWRLLVTKIRLQGPLVLWHGAMAAAGATAVGHFPWFLTYNSLQALLPLATSTGIKLARNAVIGFLASIVSDTISNSLRVIKTIRQTYPEPIGYRWCSCSLKG